MRDNLLFVLGINSGLRISDILTMQIKDVVEGDDIREHYTLKETKTGKRRKFPYSDNLKKAIRSYLDDLEEYDLNDYLFKSRQGANNAISRQQAWRILNKYARMVGIKDKIGTHTMRKTFGFHAYQNGTDLSLLQQIFNHSAPSITLRYIGITQDDMDDVVLKLNL